MNSFKIRFFFHSSFDTENNKWETIHSMDLARYYTSATVLNGYIYVAGGWNNGDDKTTYVELYDPITNDWTKVVPMRKARSEFALVELNGSLYAIGGFTENIQRFNPYTKSWTEVFELAYY